MCFHRFLEGFPSVVDKVSHLVTLGGGGIIIARPSFEPSEERVDLVYGQKFDQTRGRLHFINLNRYLLSIFSNILTGHRKTSLNSIVATLR